MVSEAKLATDLLEQAQDFTLQYNHPSMNWEIEGGAKTPQRQYFSRKIDVRPEEIRTKSVLDVGCGSGWFLQEAFEKGANKVVGIEPSGLADMIHIDGAEIVKQTFGEFTADEKFDLITFILSIEHMHPIYDVLSKAKNILNPGGIVCILAGDIDAFSLPRFDNIVTAQELIPELENVVRTERPTGFGTTIDIVRSLGYWNQVAQDVGLSVTEHKPVLADKDYIEQFPRYERFRHAPFLHVLRMKASEDMLK